MIYTRCDNCNILMDVSHEICPICKTNLVNKATTTPYEYTQLPNKLTISHIRYYTIIYKILLCACLAITIANLIVLMHSGSLTLVVFLLCVATVGMLYLGLHRLILSVVHNVGLGYKYLAILMCSAVSLCVLLDLYDYAIDWSWYIALPIILLLGSVLCMSVVVLSRSVSTNAVLNVLVMSITGVVVDVVTLTSKPHNTSLLLVNCIYLLIELSFAVYIVLFRYNEFRTTAHAKLHF
ncbi:MAG: hypothetical protein LBK70_01095 [Clostridiales bacterium]|jgi:hypothetical protein|nr:hypothetical protein [Clostridiales bacterium]